MLSKNYEKVIIGCCFLGIFVNVGIASTAFSVHQPYLVAMDGIGDTGGSLILSVRTLFSLIAMVFVDRFYQALDVRRGLLVASLCTAAGFLIYSVATSLPVFFAGAVFLGFGYGFGGMVSVTYVVNRWFTGGVGGILGFASMGSGIASIVIPLVVVRIIRAISLQAAFVAEAALAAFLGIIVFLLIRNRPSDVGLKPIEGSLGKTRSARKRTMRESPRNEHALLLVAMVFVGIFSCCGITYMSVLATSSGFDALFAATLVSIAGATLTVAKFVAGELFDFLGAPRASALMFALGAIGFALCTQAGAGSAVIMICGALLVGAGLSLGSVGISVWSLDMSSPKTRTREIKNFQVAYALGGFIANTLPGIVKDLVGTYVVSYAAMVAITLTAAIIILRYYRKYAA